MMIRQHIYSQFHKPSGILGRLAGSIMANRPSNRQRNEWIVDLLDPRSDSRVLEIGFGPGYAISLLADRSLRGKVVGIDHSETMVAVASERNREAIASGLVELHQASVEQLDELDGEYDRIMAVNAYQFWPNRIETLKRLRSLLAPGGRLAIGEQPRSKGANDDMARRTALIVDQEIRRAGFEDVSTYERQLNPLVVCVIGG